MVLFAPHNVIRDPPFSHLDLISCRNLLIYLNRAAQERVIETFHFALRPGGFLFLAHSESPDTPHDLFAGRRQGSAHLREPHGHAPGRIAARRRSSRVAPRPPLARVAERPAGRADLSGRAAPAPARALCAALARRDRGPPRRAPVRARRPLPAGGRRRTVARPDPDGAARPARRPAHRAASGACSSGATSRSRTSCVHARRRRRTASTSAVHPVLREEDPSRGYLLVTFDEHEPAATRRAAPRSWPAPAEPMTQQLEEELARLRQQLRDDRSSNTRPRSRRPRRRTKSCRR